MKIISTIAIAALLATSAQAQQRDTLRRSVVDLNYRLQALEDNNLNAGRHLRSYTTGFYTGALMQLAGTGLAVVGLSNKNEADPTEGRTLTYVGVAVGAIGSIIQLISHTNIGRAGRYLSGEGVTVPLN